MESSGEKVPVAQRYASSTSTVPDSLAGTSCSPNVEENVDVLSGIGSTTRNSVREQCSLEDALSLDDDSDESSDKEIEPKEKSPPLLLPRGFLLPRSPARLFLHNSVLQTAFDRNSALINSEDVLSRPQSRLSSAPGCEVEQESSGDLVDGPLGQDSNNVQQPMENVSVAAEVIQSCSHVNVIQQPITEMQPDSDVESVAIVHPYGNLDSGLCELIHQEPLEESLLEWVHTSDEDYLSPGDSSSGGYHTPTSPLNHPDDLDNNELGESFRFL